MAILYLLGATDCHSENVIVRGTEPVLIDAETALQPPMPAVEADLAGPGDPWRWDHVLRSGMLPGWLFSPDGGGACDASALGRLAQIRGAFPAPRWRDVNTDAMTLGEEPAPMVPLPERATIDVDAIVEGFTTMYRSLELRRDELSASAAFLALRDVRLRLVARPTQAYGQQLMGALDPHRLADGDALRAWLERLPPLTSASEVMAVARASRRRDRGARTTRHSLFHDDRERRPGDGLQR